jgi:Arc/MetJ-type ribon-helix-helix transcriptional regulator
MISKELSSEDSRDQRSFPQLALDPASEQAIQRELDRGHFTTPAEVVPSALRLLNSQEDWLQENREAINERLELSFEQSRDGQTYTPEQARQLLAERRASCQ